MAELGIAASIIGIATAGARLSTSLYTFAETASSADKSVKAIALEISLTSAVLEQLGDTLKQDAFATICSPKAVQTTETIVKECSEVYTEIDAALQKSMSSARKNPNPSKGQKIVVSLSERLKWPFLQPKMQLLSGNLERLKSTLLLMLNVLLYAKKISVEKWKPTPSDIERLQIEQLQASKEKATWNFESLKKTLEQEAGSATCSSETATQSSDTAVPTSAATVHSELVPLPTLPPKPFNFNPFVSLSSGQPSSTQHPQPNNTKAGNLGLTSEETHRIIRNLLNAVNWTQHRLDKIASLGTGPPSASPAAFPVGPLLILDPGTEMQAYIHFPISAPEERLRGNGLPWSKNETFKLQEFRLKLSRDNANILTDDDSPKESGMIGSEPNLVRCGAIPKPLGEGSHRSTSVGFPSSRTLDGPRKRLRSLTDNEADLPRPLPIIRTDDQAALRRPIALITLENPAPDTRSLPIKPSKNGAGRRGPLPMVDHRPSLSPPPYRKPSVSSSLTANAAADFASFGNPFALTNVSGWHQATTDPDNGASWNFQTGYPEQKNALQWDDSKAPITPQHPASFSNHVPQALFNPAPSMPMGITPQTRPLHSYQLQLLQLQQQRRGVQQAMVGAMQQNQPQTHQRAHEQSQQESALKHAERENMPFWTPSFSEALNPDFQFASSNTMLWRGGRELDADLFSSRTNVGMIRQHSAQTMLRPARPGATAGQGQALYPCRRCVAVKIQCDKKTPNCSQCLSSGVVCLYHSSCDGEAGRGAEQNLYLDEDCQSCNLLEIACNRKKPKCSRCLEKGLFCIERPLYVARKRRKEPTSVQKPFSNDGCLSCQLQKHTCDKKKPSCSKCLTNGTPCVTYDMLQKPTRPHAPAGLDRPSNEHALTFGSVSIDPESIQPHKSLTQKQESLPRLDEYFERLRKEELPPPPRTPSESVPSNLKGASEDILLASGGEPPTKKTPPTVTLDTSCYLRSILRPHEPGFAFHTFPVTTTAPGLSTNSDPRFLPPPFPKPQCQLCLKRFTQAEHLRSHMLTHTNTQTFELENQGLGSASTGQPESLAAPQARAQARAQAHARIQPQSPAQPQLPQTSQLPAFQGQGPLSFSSSFAQKAHIWRPPRRGIYIPRACLPCRLNHLACGGGWPCRRCKSDGTETRCVYPTHKKRGRPRIRQPAQEASNEQVREANGLRRQRAATEEPTPSTDGLKASVEYLLSEWTTVQL